MRKELLLPPRIIIKIKKERNFLGNEQVIKCGSSYRILDVGKYLNTSFN